MKTVRTHTRTQTLHRIVLIGCVASLAIIITLGVMYIQRTPALSMRALTALAYEPFLFWQLSNITPPEPSGKKARSIPVLTYHRIVSDSSDVGNVTNSRFRAQMAALKNAGWETITLAEFEAFIRDGKELPEKSFLLTFDDGAKDSFYPVDAILKALNYEAVNFIIVESSRTPKSTYYLDPREISRMLENGRWSIGSHSFDGHRPYDVDAEGRTGIFFADRLWKADANRLETGDEFTKRVHDDLVRAKDELHNEFSVPIDSFAFPLGNETGVEGANNFPEGSAITEREARKLYPFGYLQLNNQQFSANFPRTKSDSPTPADDFRVYRVHIDHDWDGARVLGILENSLPKELPFEDDFATNRGWIPAWGVLQAGRNNFELSAKKDGTSGSAFLDGSALWDNYSFDASVDWQTGHITVLADVVNSSTYHSCVFSPGLVRIQETVDGTTKTLAEKKSNDIAHGNVSVGIRVHGAVIECAWDFASIAENYSRTFSGGVGLQTWDEAHGSAHITVSSVIARPYATDYAE